MRRYSALFWVVAIASAAPLLATKYLPFTDLPEHVAAIATLDRLFRGAGDGTYGLALGKSQYLLYDVVGALLTRVVGDAQLAHRLLLALVGLLWPLSFRSLLRAMGRDERLAIFAPMVLWNRALVLGFMPFFGSVPLCFFALAMVVRQCRAPRLAQALGLAALSIALFYTHVSAWMTFGAIATGLYVVALFPRFTPARLLATFVPVVPSAVCAVVWWRAGSLVSADGSADVRRMSFVEKVGALTVWTFDAWKTHTDELCSIVWWAAFATLVVRSAETEDAPILGGRLRSGLFVAVPLLATVAIYFATPFGVGTAAYLDVRLAPLVALSALAVLSPRLDRWGTGPILAAALATLVYAADAAYEVRRCEREMLGDLDALLANVPPGRRLVSLNFEPRGTRVHYFPYIYAGSYHRVGAEAVAYYTFTEMAHWPIRFLPGKHPKTSLYSLSPCGFLLRRDGEDFDFALVQGDANPFQKNDVGPRYERIARSGRFALFQRTAEEDVAARDLPDQSTCAPP